jgi:hypothetical protein
MPSRGKLDGYLVKREEEEGNFDLLLRQQKIGTDSGYM